MRLKMLGFGWLPRPRSALREPVEDRPHLAAQDEECRVAVVALAHDELPLLVGADAGVVLEDPSQRQICWEDIRVELGEGANFEEPISLLGVHCLAERLGPAGRLGFSHRPLRGRSCAGGLGAAASGSSVC